MPPTQPPRPLAPEVIERIRVHMLTAWSSPGRGAGRSPTELRWWRVRNATIVSLMAYAGLRPAEDRTAKWADLRGPTLHVVASKTGRARDVDLLLPLVDDLAEWRAVADQFEHNSLIVATTDGDEWKRHDWQNWRLRVYQPAAVAAGVTGDLRPYRLRASFVSLLLWEGRSWRTSQSRRVTRSRRWQGTTPASSRSSRMRAANRLLKPSSRPASEPDVRQVYDAGKTWSRAPMKPLQTS